MTNCTISVTQKSLIQPAIVVRDKDGYWGHPDLIDTEDAEVFKAWLEAQGLTYSISSLESEDDTSIRHVTDIMSEISAASQEQSQGIAQINQAISQMDDATQQNAALVEQAAAASESLQDQANHLAQVVSVFKLDGMQMPAPTTQIKRPATSKINHVLKHPKWIANGAASNKS